MQIEIYIPTGQANAISRRQLAIRAGLSDRDMRLQIAKARADGIPIINRQDGRGYYISDNPDEIERFSRQEYSRAVSISRAAAALNNYANELRRKGAFINEI